MSPTACKKTVEMSRHFWERYSFIVKVTDKADIKPSSCNVAKRILTGLLFEKKLLTKLTTLDAIDIHNTRPSSRIPDSSAWKCPSTAVSPVIMPNPYMAARVPIPVSSWSTTILSQKTVVLLVLKRKPILINIINVQITGGVSSKALRCQLLSESVDSLYFFSQNVSNLKAISKIISINSIRSTPIWMAMSVLSWGSEYRGEGQKPTEGRRKRQKCVDTHSSANKRVQNSMKLERTRASCSGGIYYGVCFYLGHRKYCFHKACQTGRHDTQPLEKYPTAEKWR